MVISAGAGWVFIGILILVIFLVVAIVQKRQAMATAAVKMLSVFIVLSIGYVFIINKVDITSFPSVVDGVKVYFNWMLAFFDKTIDVTSYAIKQDWTANSTLGK